MKVFQLVSQAVQKNLRFCNKSTRFDQQLNIIMLAVVYFFFNPILNDVGYATRMIKKRKNMVTVSLLVVIKKIHNTYRRLPKRYQEFEAQLFII